MDESKFLLPPPSSVPELFQLLIIHFMSYLSSACLESSFITVSWMTAVASQSVCSCLSSQFYTQHLWNHLKVQLDSVMTLIKLFSDFQLLLRIKYRSLNRAHRTRYEQVLVFLFSLLLFYSQSGSHCQDSAWVRSFVPVIPDPRNIASPPPTCHLNCRAAPAASLSVLIWCLSLSLECRFQKDRDYICFGCHGFSAWHIISTQ